MHGPGREAPLLIGPAGRKFIRFQLKPDPNAPISPFAPPFMHHAAASVAAPKSLAGKYLTIVLAQASYGISVLAVREIIRMQKVTPVPQMPAFVKGVINLRGRVIPVVDLRVKFSVSDAIGERTCIVVVQVRLPSDQNVQMGLIVDSVEEVVTLQANEVEPTPDFGAAIDTSYLLGMAKVKGAVKTLLDIDRVIASEALRVSTPS